MIDFRYHLVSLISVFLALAVGIVLGAGPLKAPIGQSLQSQVDALRADRDALRTEVTNRSTEVRGLNRFVETTASKTVGDRLKGVSVNLVTAADAEDADVKRVADQLEHAGASVVHAGGLTKKSFSDEADETLIKELKKLSPGVAPEPRRAVAEALTEVWGASKSASALNRARSYQKILVDRGRVRAGQLSRADVVVFIAGNLTASKDVEGETDEARDAYVDAILALQDATPMVVAGPTGSAEHGLIGEMRNNRAARTTVDGTNQSAGALVTVLATAELKDTGRTGAYGFAANADALYPGAAK